MSFVPPNSAIWVLVFAMGAAIGSFLNVVIYRWPQRESVIWPPSHCMSCGVRLGFIDLIPILSYIFLLGRCRRCRHGFSPRYAIVELATASLLVGCLVSIEQSWRAVLIFVVCCCLLLIFFIDLDHMIIPDELVIIIALIAVGLNAHELLWLAPAGPQAQDLSPAMRFTQDIGGVAKTVHLPASIVGIVMGSGAFLFVSWVFERLLAKPVLGLGDVKLAGALGAHLGPGYLLLAWALISVVLGAAVALVLLALRIRRRGDYIPFGPMLALGGVLLLVFPEVGGYVISLYAL